MVRIRTHEQRRAGRDGRVPGGQGSRLTEDPREEWGGFDAEVPGCGTVEVKSAAYVQSWEQQNYTRISFDIAKRKSAWNPKTGEHDRRDPPQRIADVYIFCLFKHRCQNTINPLDVEQWEFFVVPRSKLDHSDWRDRKSIGLNSLSRLTKAIAYDGLRDEVHRAMTVQRRSVDPRRSFERSTS